MPKTKQLTAAQVLENAVTEKELKHNVEQIARQFGWRHYHTFISVYSEGGFPDEILTRGARTVWMELKTMRGKIKPNQIEWLDALSDNPANECFVIRPNQLELVAQILGGPDQYQGPERWSRENHFGE